MFSEDQAFCESVYLLVPIKADPIAVSSVIYYNECGNFMLLELVLKKDLVSACLKLSLNRFEQLV